MEVHTSKNSRVEELAMAADLLDPNSTTRIEVYEIGIIETSNNDLDAFLREKAPSHYKNLPGRYNSLSLQSPSVLKHRYKWELKGYKLLIQKFGIESNQTPSNLLREVTVHLKRAPIRSRR